MYLADAANQAQADAAQRRERTPTPRRRQETPGDASKAREDAGYSLQGGAVGGGCSGWG